MKKVILTQIPEDSVILDDLDEDVPIFLVKDKKIAGLLVEEDGGWITRIGGNFDSTGYHNSRRAAIKEQLVFCPDSIFVTDVEISIK